MAESNPLQGKDFIQDDFLGKAIKDLIEFKSEVVSTGKVIKTTAQQVEKSLNGTSAARKEDQKTITEAEKQTQKLVLAQEKYELSLKETEREIIKLRAAQTKQNQVNKLTEKLNRSTEGSYDKLSAQYSLNKIRLNAMSDAQRNATKSGQRLERQTREIFEEMNRLQKATGKATLQVGQYGRAMQVAAATARNLASALGFAGVLFTLVTLFRNAFNTLKSFDQEMNNLAAIAEKSRDQLTRVEKAIRDVGKGSINSAVSIAQMATSLFALGKSESEVIKLLPVVDELAIALRAPADAAGQLLVGMLNAFGESANSARHFGNIIAGLRTKTALDFQGIVDALQFLAPTAEAAGVSFQKAGAVLGVLRDNTVKAARAGRLMSSSFLRLADQGLTLDQALIKLNKVQQTTTDELVLLRAASELFGKESGALGLILASNIDKVDKYTEALVENEDALFDFAEQNAKSISAFLKKTGAAWDELVLSIEDGTGVMSIAIKLVLSDLTNFFILLASSEPLWLKTLALIDGTGASMALLKARILEAKNAEKERQKQLETTAQDLFNKAIDKGVDTNEKFLATLRDTIKANEDNADVLDRVKELYGELSEETETAAVKTERLKISIDALNAKSLPDESKWIKKLTDLLKNLNNELFKTTKTNEAFVKSFVDGVSEQMKSFQFIQDAQGKWIMITGEAAAAEKERLKAEKDAAAGRKFLLEQDKLRLQKEKEIADERREINQRNLETLQQGILEVAMTFTDAANRRAEETSREFDEAKEDLQRQSDLRDAGKEADIEGAEERFKERKKQNQKALKEQERARKAEESIQTAQQLGSLVTATAKIFESMSGLGILGTVLAVAAIGAMFASFAASKIKARNATKLGDGGTFDVSGGSHASGNDTSLGVHGGREIKVEKGERVGVISAKSVRKYGSTVSDVIDSLNSGEFEKKYSSSFTSMADMPDYIVNSSGDLEGMKEFWREENASMKKEMSDTIKSIPQPIYNLGRKGIRKDVRLGNTVYRDVQEENQF